MTLPRVQPIIPTRRAAPFDGAGWLFDVKYDGFRALCYLEQGRALLISRNGKPFSRFTALGAEVAAELEVDEAILDGEVIAADETGRPRFWGLVRGNITPAYVAFDLLWLNGTDLRPLSLGERRAALRGLLPKGLAMIAEAVSVEGRGCELFELIRAHDLEGIVAKDSPIPTAPAPSGSRSKTRLQPGRRPGRAVQPGARVEDMMGGAPGPLDRGGKRLDRAVSP